MFPQGPETGPSDLIWAGPVSPYVGIFRPGMGPGVPSMSDIFLLAAFSFVNLVSSKKKKTSWSKPRLLVYAAGRRWEYVGSPETHPHPRLGQFLTACLWRVKKTEDCNG